ncbi:MAG: antibiotic biosynthesis monooxygenase family protein [Sciscionella sp.]
MNNRDTSTPAADGPITLINASEIPADRSEEFAEEWRSRAAIMAAAPGFRDARLHRAITPGARFGFVNVAHWDSRAAWETAQTEPAFRRQLDELPGTTRSALHATAYQVVVEFDRQGLR